MTNFKDVFLQSQQQLRNNPELEINRRQEMISKRWGYFWGSLGFVLLCTAFLILGFLLKRQMNVIAWVIWMVCNLGLLGLGIVTLGWYLKVILENRRNSRQE